MNELYVELRGGSFFYFKTNASEVEKAFHEFLDAMESAGVNADNILVRRFELRSESGEIIEEANKK